MAYSKNFLTNVILRVDFLSHIDEINQELSNAVKQKCARYFPIFEERHLKRKEILINNNKPLVESTTVNERDTIEWHFYGSKRDKELCISDSAMYIDVHSYSCFDDLQKQFLDLIAVLLKEYKEAKINRIGLRYINQLVFSVKPFNQSWSQFWAQYVCPGFVRNMELLDNQNTLTRNMNSIETSCDDYQVHLQYGIFNSDYPAPNKKVCYIIDIDTYSFGLLDYDCLEEKTVDLNHSADQWFEKSITERLRSVLNGVSDA